MAKTRRSYKGGAASTTITGTLTSGGTNFVIAAYTGWPYGANPFYVVIEPGTANEEKVLVTRSGASDTTVNVTTRGVDDTTAAQHAAGSAVYPVFTAVDADEANELASTMTTKGDILTHGSSTFARLAVGTNAYVLKADSSTTTGLAWGQVATAGIADDAVTSAKIAAGAVGASELASSAVETAKINDGAVTNAKLGLTEVKLRRAASLSVSESVDTAYSEHYISWDTEDADTSGFISTPSNTLTVPSGATGLYSFAVVLTNDMMPGVGTTSVYMHSILLNSDEIGSFENQDRADASNGAIKVGQSFGNLYLTAGDTIKFKIAVSFTTSLIATDITARLWMTRIMD